MRSLLWMFVLTPALCTPAAFAVDKVSVDLPFSFASHGKIFPASQYDVTLNNDRSFLTLTSRTNPADTISWTTITAGAGPNDTVLSIQFDQGSMHELHMVRLGRYQTRILDGHLDAPKDRVQAKSGQ